MKKSGKRVFINLPVEESDWLLLKELADLEERPRNYYVRKFIKEGTSKLRKKLEKTNSDVEKYCSGN